MLNESKSSKNCEKSHKVRVWPWPLGKVGENDRFFRVQLHFVTLAQTFLSVILALIQATHHHLESAILCEHTGSDVCPVGLQTRHWTCYIFLYSCFIFWHILTFSENVSAENILISPLMLWRPHYSPCLSRAVRWNKKQRGCLPALHCSLPFILRRITAVVEIIACSNYESISCVGFSVWWGENSQEQFWTMCETNAREHVSGH